MKENDNSIYFDTLEGVFTKEGYFNVESMIEDKYPFLFVIGGRGTGKTYSTLKYLMDKRHVFIRRTQDEIKTLADMDSVEMEMSESPWRQLNEDFDGNGHCIKAFKVANGKYTFCDIGNKFNWTMDREELEKIRKPLANIIALSSAGKVKGAGYENVEYIFYDEFIPLQGTRDTKLDGVHFTRIIETISRNREMSGKSPTKVICMANATTIANPVFLEFGLVNIVYKMVQSKYVRVDMPDRGIRVLILPPNKDFVGKKKQTALFKALPSTSSSYKSDIDNEFIFDDFTDVVEKYNLTGYKPVYIFEEMNSKMYTLYAKGNDWIMAEGLKGKQSKARIFNMKSVADIYQAETMVFSDTWFDYKDGYMKFDSYETKVAYFTIVNKKISPR